MSSLLLSAQAWQTVVDALVDPDPNGETLSGQLGEPWEKTYAAWHRANVRAVSARYGIAKCVITPGASPSWTVMNRPCNPYRRIEASETLAIYIKTLSCLHYQCCESVPARLAKAHEKRMVQMIRAIGHLSYRLVVLTPEYEAAPWG